MLPFAKTNFRAHIPHLVLLYINLYYHLGNFTCFLSLAEKGFADWHQTKFDLCGLAGTPPNLDMSGRANISWQVQTS